MIYFNNKSESIDTVVIRHQLHAISRAIGFKIWEEVTVDGCHRIDYVLGVPADENSMRTSSLTGIELKVMLNDLKNNINGGSGKNVFSFFYNYFLVPEDIAYHANKYILSVAEYEHVGILVYNKYGEIILDRPASFYQPTDEQAAYPEFKKSNAKKLGTVIDSVTGLLSQAAFDDDVETMNYHSFITGKDGKYQYVDKSKYIDICKSVSKPKAKAAAK